MNKLKNLLYLLMAVLVVGFTACDDNDDDVKTYEVSVQLNYSDDFTQEAGVSVSLMNASEYVYKASTNESGIATFKVPAGIYAASATDVRALDGVLYNLNATKSNIVIDSKWDSSEVIALELSGVKQSQVIIKELYVGGCPKDDNPSSRYTNDRYVVLYNNSNYVANIENLCLGMVLPYNSHANNNDYDDNGKLFYEAEGWIPAGQAFWYYPQEMIIEPYEQIVIALNAAIDNTITYSQSINFVNPGYYCTYDPEVFSNAASYPAPSEVIPSSHYFRAYLYGLGNAWTLSNMSPAFFIFNTEGTTPAAFAADTNNESYHGTSTNASALRKKVPVDWVIDGIEVFKSDETENTKRLTSNVDGGYVYLANGMGYTNYRNVDKEATEAIADNEGKLVYSYSLGTEINGVASTDPSNIDAEASIKNGAKIVYKDTNNSTSDFHQRAKASLRD